MEEFSVKSACQLCGINPNTLRAWERRYKALSPARSKTGRRFYTKVEIERLKLLVDLVKKGHAIGNIGQLETPALVDLLEMSQQSEDDSLRARAELSEQKEREIQVILDDLVGKTERYDLKGIHERLTHCRITMDAKTYVLNLVSPLFRKIGNLVAADKLSIMHEHSLSAILKIQLGELLTSLSNVSGTLDSDDTPTVALVTQEGDHHEFGILLGAILCTLNHVKPYLLGANVPVVPLSECVGVLDPDIILVGAVPLAVKERVMSQKEFIERLDRTIPSPIDIWLGGYCDFDIEKSSLRPNFKHIPDFYTLDGLLKGMKADLHN